MSKKSKAAALERCAKAINQIDRTLVRIASMLATLADQTKPLRDIAEDWAGPEPAAFNASEEDAKPPQPLE